MDYQQQQWRSRPPIQGHNSLCPTCSFPHFPFCPPHPPAFHFAADHSFPPPPPPPPPPFVHRPIFGNPRPYEHFAYGEVFAPQSQDYGDGNGFAGDGDRSYKRPRVDDFGSGSVLSDDERRLKLIREHGGAPSERNGFNSDANHGNLSFFRQLESNRAESSGNQNHFSFDPNHQLPQHHGMQNPNLGGYFPRPERTGPNPMHASSRFYGVHPPLPASPPPPLPMDSPLQPRRSPSLFPVPVSSSAITSSPCPPIPEGQSLAQPYFHSKPLMHTSTGFATQAIYGTLPKQYMGEEQSFPLRNSSSDKATIVDASQLFKQPHRATRPDHFVIILRGLPGSGKSYLAKMLRDTEVESGGAAPRIHSMDEYFMIEVEKVEEGDFTKSSGSVRGKKRVIKKVMEYCYEPEMEEAYRASMLKAFKKTVEEGAFTFIIVDDRNLRVADFAQFWAIAKSSGYEVYILEASYKDPAGCAARNVHGFTLDDIQKMAGEWEEAPSFHLRVDVKSLFSGDDLKKSGIQEVDMAMEDEDAVELPSGLLGQITDKTIAPAVGDDTSLDSSEDENSWNAEEENETEVKELGRSKWSNELDEDDTEQTEPIKGNLNALSGLIQAYGKEAKSVRWGDQGGVNTGFSISAAKKAKTLSLVIGPGAGYNLKSNPLPKEDRFTPRNSDEELKKHSVFQEQLRAECESFKAAFSRRQLRIGLDCDE
ncbi:YLP motif-containing protein 1 isoform X2 [Morus notabilis]|uniref:YLP motif-containing protein 1 isoform X2 n=1 Tax=Morus notabilis TaxID=981085 RepID=UPI000CED1388|nr:YLP motif-containing protein 1 isoform X2 [Morus notabilis]